MTRRSLLEVEKENEELRAIVREQAVLLTKVHVWREGGLNPVDEKLRARATAILEREKP